MTDNYVSVSQVRENRQNEVCLRWINSHLSKRRLKITDLYQLCDGVHLPHLYELLTGEILNFNHHPFCRIQICNNLSIVLKKINMFVEECGIRIQYSPSCIASGNIGAISGMVWILMTKFKSENIENLKKKQVLLGWVKGITKEYNDVNITDFSWKNGIVLLSILDFYIRKLNLKYPEIIDFDNLDPKNKDNCENALVIAGYLGIPKLLELEDITGEYVEEKLIMMYVESMYNFFKNLESKKDNGEIICWMNEDKNWEENGIEGFSVNIKNMNKKVCIMKLFMKMGVDSSSKADEHEIKEIKKEKEMEGEMEENDLSLIEEDMESCDSEINENEIEINSDGKENIEDCKIDQIEDKLRILDSMGFRDRKLCMDLLKESGGDIQRLINNMYDL